MEGLINYQMDISIRINKAFSNFKKSPRDRITESYVETKLDNIEQLWVEFITTHQELIKAHKRDEIQGSDYAKEEIYDKTEEVYTDFKSLLKKHLKMFTKTKVTCDNGDSSSSKGKPASSSSVKLPKITIPSFSGNYSEWVSFRDLFVSLIHSNESLDDVQKLHYLKGHLTGEAEFLIRQIPVTSANYKQCWQQLENRFNNKRYIANCILKRLFSQRNSNVESAAALKDLLNTTTDCMYGLKNIGIDVSSWDIIIIHIVNYKLDPETRKQWELSVSADSSGNLPTLTQFTDFLQSRFRALECIEPKQRLSNPNVINKPRSMHVANSVCELCSENHKLCFCKKFAQMDYNSRHEFVATNRICFNCLGGNHAVKACQSTMTCRICKRKYHSLLHPNSASVSSGSGSLKDTNAAAFVTCENTESEECHDPSVSENELVSCFSSDRIPVHSQVLLATALVEAETSNGNCLTIRALLDQGSQASFITETIAQNLGVRKIPVKGIISGLEGNKSVSAKYMVELKVHSRFKPEVVITVRAYVLKTITTFLPSKKVVELNWLNVNEVQLADPQYHTPNKIDILLGAEVYGQVIEAGVKKGPHGFPIAQATSLGWIISGPVDHSTTVNKAVVTMHVCANDNDFLKKFWELENDPKPAIKHLTEEEILCEQFYDETTKRDCEGRYIIRLPFKSDRSGLMGNSRDVAVRRLKGLVSKLNKNKDLKNKYTEVIQEYLQLDHMERIPETEKENKACCYLPHHAVLRNDKETSQVRVVFDASAKNEKGISLNDSLMIGPTLQPELRHLIMRWRISKICLAADIIKMYRQIKTTEQDADFQRIVWIEQSNNELQDYRLKRLTFGTAAAPYLAVKTLQQVAIDEGENFPRAAEIVKRDFYMDDLLTSCDSVDEAVTIYEEMNQLLKRGGFQLQKWRSNSEELLSKIKESKEESQEALNLKLDQVVKLLGLTWNRTLDIFRYTVALPQETGPVTKRIIISEIARLYDPLGWVAPSVIIAKIMIQKLWISGMDWDDEVPSNLTNEWITYRKTLPKLGEICVPRWFGMNIKESQVELHGFSDASKIGYAAAVYIRLIDKDGNIKVTLVTAKTKVAPIKQISIPRLELCGAVLVTRLLIEVAEVLGVSKANVRAWTDSTVVLAWLNSHPSKWQTFVANRVSEILSTLDSNQWSHVSSGQNPADCASRGVNPSDLAKNEMWFNRPEFLLKSDIPYHKPKHFETHLEETKVHLTVNEDLIYERYSSLSTLVRVIAYCKRFLTLRSGQCRPATVHLSAHEISDALTTCLKLCQRAHFKEEIAHIERHKEHSTIKGPLKSLNPFIDHKGILRVGRRLANSHLDENTKHPILLPKRSKFTDLIIADAHCRTLHGGPHLMLTFIGTKYYILSGKSLIKSYIRKCLKCIRYSTPTSTQLMGQLPAARVSPGRPFQCSGVDYAGPVNVRTTKGHHSTKGYICLFICMATRAIHLEVVSDLTTQGFLASFRRFVARRGICTDIWSDNGTNFVGASRELKALFAEQISAFSKEVAEYLANNGTTWQFIPPHSLNFGGLWESGIKSTKFHLRRVLGDLTLTYEELATVLAQIEACLNSRPLSRIDSDQDSIEVLTPGHFLVGGPLLSVPDYNYDQSNISYLRRWQLTQKLTQTFWKRWSQEYLTRFLHQYRWSYQKPEPELGSIVLVKEDDLPPCRWLLGRVVAKHPGSDNITRVVTILTKNSQIKRPTSKLCILPVSD